MLPELAHDLVHLLACLLRQKDLPAVTRTHHPGGQMDVSPDVLGRIEQRRPGVQAHPHPHAAVRQRRLRLPRCSSTGHRLLEGDEERVALVVDLIAAVPAEDLAQDTAVLAQRLSVGLRAELVQKPGRLLDVAEQKRDRSGRKLGHLCPSLARLHFHAKM